MTKHVTARHIYRAEDIMTCLMLLWQGMEDGDLSDASTVKGWVEVSHSDAGLLGRKVSGSFDSSDVLEMIGEETVEKWRPPQHILLDGWGENG